MNAPSAGFAVSPLTPAIGGLVSGVDLARPLSDPTFQGSRRRSPSGMCFSLKARSWTRPRSAISPHASANFTFTRLSACRWRAGNHVDRDAPGGSSRQ